MKAPRLITIAGLALTLLAAPPAAHAQQPGKVYRIGVPSTGGPEQENFVWSALRGLLRERGWDEGQNLVVEWRYAEAKYERLPDLAAELVRLGPDLIMARGGPGATAAKRATATIPIPDAERRVSAHVGCLPHSSAHSGAKTGNRPPFRQLKPENVVCP
jgi:putative tryptophan/tyrosine transport system substrate-binding protein